MNLLMKAVCVYNDYNVRIIFDSLYQSKNDFRITCTSDLYTLKGYKKETGAVLTSCFDVFFPAGYNPCDPRSSPCTHICLLSASGPRFYSCACPSGWTLAADQFTCARGARYISR